MTSNARSDELTEYCSYALFGQRFFELAVTEERVLSAVSGLAGDVLEFGPIGVGPGRLAKVRANGVIGAASIVKREGDGVAFVLTIPVDLRLVVDLGLDEHRFRAAVTLHLNLTARAAEPLRVVIDIATPTADDVQVTIKAESLRASVLQLVGGVEGEIRRFVARYVAKEIDKPHIRRARDIDVAARIAGAWSRTVSQ